jgi:hypothetical protein
VAVVQYTFTHKQYIEQRNENNTQNNTKIWEGSGPCPVFASYTLAFALQLSKNTEEPQSGQPKSVRWYDEDTQLYNKNIQIYNQTIRIHIGHKYHGISEVFCAGRQAFSSPNIFF